jgi:uncharacterized protein (TIGR02996 family)
MKSKTTSLFILRCSLAFLGVSWFAGCGKQLGSTGKIYDAEVVAEAAKLTAVKDPVQEEIYAFRLKTRLAYNTRRFNDLEAQASEIRSGKQKFGNGSWKISEFYDSLACRSDEPEGMWQLHDRIHKDWIVAKPNSITARVAYADFLTEYAWHARGSGFADTVTAEGSRLMMERLSEARKITDQARELPEKDPVLWRVVLRIALGQGWPKADYDALVDEATAFEPKFWNYDTSRAYSLLPRWHGKEGDWEAYAEEASKRPSGLGPEIYARIVIHLRGYHENIFRETKVSWPKTREGLDQMIKTCPASLDILNNAAMLATMAEDRDFAKACFARMGDVYLPNIWEGPEQMIHCRQWSETGKW